MLFLQWIPCWTGGLGCEVAVDDPPETLWNLTERGSGSRCERGLSEDQIKIRETGKPLPDRYGNRCAVLRNRWCLRMLFGPVQKPLWFTAESLYGARKLFLNRKFFTGLRLRATATKASAIMLIPVLSQSLSPSPQPMSLHQSCTTPGYLVVNLGYCITSHNVRMEARLPADKIEGLRSAFDLFQNKLACM